MDLKAECELSFYEEIYSLNSTAVLVKNISDNQFYVKKQHQHYDPDIYKTLQANPHAGIPQIYGIYEMDDGTLTTIEQFIHGQTLDEYLTARGQLEEADAQRIVRQLAQTLRFLHDLCPPILHRDVKLTNVMLNDSGEVKLVDFNVSRFYRESVDRDTEIRGTEGYAAPEQYGFMQTDFRSDVYSLGVLLKKLLYGKQHSAQYTGRLAGIAEKCVRFNPDERYQTMDAFLQALDGQPQISTPPPTGKGRFWPPGFRTKTPWKMLVAAVIYALAILFIISYSSTTDIPAVNLIGNVLWAILIAALISLYTNYLGMRRFFPLVNHERLIVRMVGFALFSVLFFLAFTLLLLLVHTAFGIFP